MNLNCLLTGTPDKIVNSWVGRSDIFFLVLKDGDCSEKAGDFDSQEHLLLALAQIVRILVDRCGLTGKASLQSLQMVDMSMSWCLHS